MTQLISKTLFQEFLYCPKNIWLKLHKPELLSKFTLSEFELHLMEQGNEVESLAHNLQLFHGGIEVESKGDERVQETERLMTEKTPVIFQATFIKDGFIVRNDALKYDSANKCWDLYEIKATNSIHEGGRKRDHIVDIAFQASVLRRAGVPLGKCFHVRLNKEYVRAGDIDVEALFEVENVSEKVNGRMPEVEGQMEVAVQYLNKEEEPPGGCECVYGGRKSHCTMFKYNNPQIPDYSVHDISHIHKTKLLRFMEQNIYGIGDIEDPDSFKLSERQSKQVLAHKLQKPIIDIEKIREDLTSLKFPLYFLDYETFPSAIPVFNGYKPYQQIPFQFSLDILRAPNGKCEHVEYLQTSFMEPSENIAKLLKEHIRGGTVIVWNQSFEIHRNMEIGVRLPEYAPFLEELNKSVYDLMSIFFDQHYIHDDFRGSASIKKVLPVIAPELTYDGLDIHEGAQAAKSWWTMVAPETSQTEKDKTARDLRIYCGRDTEAMYVIWKHLQEMI
ncbi:MAG: DUF2779 domain-containing protein [bacterium]|nr:DUF2779 domain-containing protein [bacterium]